MAEKRSNERRPEVSHNYAKRGVRRSGQDFALCIRSSHRTRSLLCLRNTKLEVEIVNRQKGVAVAAVAVAVVLVGSYFALTNRGQQYDDGATSGPSSSRAWDIDSADTPGGCWTFYSALHPDEVLNAQPGDSFKIGGGIHGLVVGEQVDFEWESVIDQDGYKFRAIRVRPQREIPLARRTNR